MYLLTAATDAEHVHLHQLLILIVLGFMGIEGYEIYMRCMDSNESEGSG